MNENENENETNETPFAVQQVIAVQQLTRELPLNDFKLPIGIYRTDMLPWHAYEPVQAPHAQPLSIVEEEDDNDILTSVVGSEELQLAEDILMGNDSEEHIDDPTPNLPVEARERRIAGFLIDELEGAFIWLNYDEGFPAMPSGTPFWDNLDFEPPEAYSIFQRYLQMHQGRKADDDDEEDYGTPATGIRSISILASELHGDNELLGAREQYQTYYHLYYWGLRSKSYDIFKIAQHRRQQEIRAIEVEDSHFITGSRLMNRLLEYMDDDEDFWDMMTPKTGIDMFKTLVQLQRISAGLPAAGPASKEDGKRSTARGLETILRQVAQESNVATDDVSKREDLIAQILKDPEMTERLQRFVIEMDQNGG